MANNSIKALAIAAALGAAVQFSDFGKNAIADGTQPQDISSAREAVKSHTELALAGEVIKSIPGEVDLNTKETQEKLKNYAKELEKAKNQNVKENSSTAPQFENTNFNKYYSEIQENFGDDIANVFKENAEYFTSIVKKGMEEHTLRYLDAVFGNPGDIEVVKIFESRLNKMIKPGVEIDTKRLTNLNEKLLIAGNELHKKLNEQRLALASKEEIIAKYKIEIRELEKKLKEFDKNPKINKKEIEKLKKQIKERGGAIDTLNKKVG